MLNAFQWPGRSAADLQRFAQDAARELASRIPGFPPFLLRAASRLHPRLARESEGCWAFARTGQLWTYVLLRPRAKRLRFWRIDFNDRHPEPFDMELVLYHELAHFLADDVALFQPSHGLLWATCCDALMLLMEMDEDSLDEGTEWIFEVEEDERRRTFQTDHIADAGHWRQVRGQTRAVLAGLLDRSGSPIRYDDLKLLIRAAWKRCAPKPPQKPQRPGRKRASAQPENRKCSTSPSCTS